MEIEKRSGLIVETVEIQSEPLKRTARVDFYLPPNISGTDEADLLLINDGQDLVTMGFRNMIDVLIRDKIVRPLCCVGIHCGEDRRNEYGMVYSPDYKGRGLKAALYQQFIFTELLPYIRRQYPMYAFSEKVFAGFSLGAISALDIVWNHPDVFSKVGVFSGSLWWRSKDKHDKDYDQFSDRLMHVQIRKGTYHPNLKFFFQCGEQDESEDRNKNGVIDSIDDTIDLMRELIKKGYKEGKDIYYLQMPDGKHDVASWAKAFPCFFRWGWG